MKKRFSMAVSAILAGFILGGCGTSGSGTSQTITGVPSAPSGVVSSTSGANQVTVTWTPVTGATSYNLYWSTTSGVTAASGAKIANANSPYTHAGLNANITYYYIVTAVNSFGESVASSQSSATSVAVPAAPSGVTAVGGSNQATVTWSAVSGATSYNIYWSTISGVSKTSGTKLAGVSSPYIQSGLGSNTTYYYIVTAVSSVGESVPSSQASASTNVIAGSAPSAPTGVSALGGTNQDTITWSPVGGATSYNIYWTNDPTHVMKDMDATKITGVTSPYHHTNLAAATIYAYVVTALNASGESVESNIASANTSVTDGVALYTTNCSGCHGALATSSKKGRTAATIQNSGMASHGNLNTAQVQAVADVLAW